MTEDRAPELTPEQKATVARFGIHDVSIDGVSLTARRGFEISQTWVDETTWKEAAEKPTTVSCEAFMADHQMSRTDFREILREYRSETGYSAFEWGERDTLDSQFMSWFEWERLA